jgi:hypothetical protein
MRQLMINNIPKLQKHNDQIFQPPSNIEKYHNILINNITKKLDHNHLIITEADKGNSLVIMQR